MFQAATWFYMRRAHQGVNPMKCSDITDTRFSRRELLQRAGQVGAAALVAGNVACDSVTGAGPLGSPSTPDPLEASAIAAASSGGIPVGDVAILRFLAAAELIETDFWEQYAELANN